MALTDEEIRHRLTAFAAKWSVYAGSERGGAQTFLNQLFECYGQDREECGARFEAPQAGRFLDLIWPGVCIIEMKAPTEAKRLAKHRKQALDYWENSDDPDNAIRRPRWVVVCAFNKLEVWEPGAFSKPLAEIDLVDLPDQLDALGFLAGRDPRFSGNQATVTREAVALVSDVYTQLRERRAADSEVLRNFILQSVWCMFAEDLGMIPRKGFTTVLDGVRQDSRRSTADELGSLFQWLNTPESQPRHGMYEGTPYVNGRLFETPARVHLEPGEIDQLLKASSDYNWRQVQPTIFGSLLEGGLGHDKQWHLGAHYTHEADIQKIVQPSIVEPWTERIDSITTHAEAIAAQNDLMQYVVLDPACGSGNFLYVAYQELRRIEKRLREVETDLRRKAGMKEQGSLALFFPLSNMKGIEIDGFAVALARVTLWMGHKLAVDELDLSEPTLPLADLSGIQQGDALRMKWPRASVVIGNPPFHGDRNLRRELGDQYVEWLRREFGVGIKDYCVYWFRRTVDHLSPGQAAGLVATNSVSQNRARSASLDYIVERGGVITNAVSAQSWPGDASVTVSIVNWTMSPAVAPAVKLLDGQGVGEITSALVSGDRDVSSALDLKGNAGVSFYGVVPSGKGFILGEGEASRLLADQSAAYHQVIRPFLGGDDVNNNPGSLPSRWIIDFSDMPLEEAAKYPLALEIVRKRVKPVRDAVRRESYRRRWWQFAEPVMGMRRATEGLPRFICGTSTGTRVFFCWVNAGTVPQNSTNVFALADDASLGVLSSSIHYAWARERSSSLQTHFRYTKTTAFESFPWPSLNDVHRLQIGEIAARLNATRTRICTDEGFGLTRLYNHVEEGAWTDIEALHRELDEAVAEAYGWSKSVAHDPDETNRRLLKLNQAITAGEVEYAPFGSAL